MGTGRGTDVAINFTPTTTPAAAAPGMDMATALMQPQGEAPAYGSDAWAMETGGQGAMILRELMRGLSSEGLAALAPENAGNVFSPQSRALLAPEYQQRGK